MSGRFRNPEVFLPPHEDGDMGMLSKTQPTETLSLEKTMTRRLKPPEPWNLLHTFVRGTQDHTSHENIEVHRR